MEPHIIFSYRLSGPVRGEALTDEATIIAALHAPDLAWLHLRASDPATASWAAENLSWLDPLALAALLEEETRPRATEIEPGVLVILRGVNTNPGADPEDMVSIRLYVDSARIVSMSVRDLTSVADLREKVAAGRGPVTAGHFLCSLIDRLNDHIARFLHGLDEACDDLEKEVLDAANAELRERIGDIRRQVILFRRHIAPQREALERLIYSELALFSVREHRRLSEAHERLTRVIEDTDALRDRLAVVKDEMQNALSERLNRNLYMLSLVSAVFLPLGFLTGLFGINVGGVPGVDQPFAFWIVCAGLFVIGVAVLVVLRRLRWI